MTTKTELEQSLKNAKEEMTDREVFIAMLARGSFEIESSGCEVAGEPAYKVETNGVEVFFNPDGTLRYIGRVNSL